MKITRTSSIITYILYVSYSKRRQPKQRTPTNDNFGQSENFFNRLLVHPLVEQGKPLLLLAVLLISLRLNLLFLLFVAASSLRPPPCRVFGAICLDDGAVATPPKSNDTMRNLWSNRFTRVPATSITTNMTL